MTTVKANIKPALLIWAREGLGFSLADAAKKLGVSEERLASWEADKDSPTINQLRKMTEVYKRPLAVFFLPDPPAGFQVMKDFRRMPGTILGRHSPSLLLEIRRAQERRQLALDLLAEIEEKPKPFTLTLKKKDNGIPTETEVLESVMQWKQKRRPPLDRLAVAPIIRNLGILRWLDVKPDISLPISENEYVPA